MALFYRLGLQRDMRRAGLVRLAMHADAKQWQKAAAEMEGAEKAAPADKLASQLEKLFGGAAA